MISRNFDLFLHAGSANALVIYASQYDQGETWTFTLYNADGTQYVPSSGSIVGVKSDGNLISNAGTVTDGKVVITETQQMTACAGKAIFELQIDGLTHGTANFILQVEESPTENGVASESDLSMIQQALNSVTPTVISETVTDWMDENLTPTTPVVDASLTVQGAAADAKKTGDEISDLKSQIAQGGLKDSAKQALLAVLEVCLTNDDNASDLLDALRSALYDVEVLSISAVFTQGDNEFYLNSSLDDLKPYLVVTANYDNGTSGVITAYTLSGDLTAGDSVITVTYDGKSTTFTVNVFDGYDVTPLLANFTVLSNQSAQTEVTYNSEANSLNVKTKTNGTYRGATVDFHIDKGYLYRLTTDLAYTSGDIRILFRDKAKEKSLGGTSTITESGTIEKVYDPSNYQYWDDTTSPNGEIVIFITYSTSKAGDGTFSNFKVIKYLPEEE